MKLLIFVSCLAIFFFSNGLFAQQSEDPEKLVGVVANKTVGIKFNNTVCVLLSFNHSRIEISSPKDPKITFVNKTYDISETEVVLEDSYCNGVNDTQRLSLKTGDGFYILKFDFKLKKKAYFLSNLTLVVDNSTLLSELNATASSIEKSLPSPDLKVLKAIGKGFSFDCKHRYVLKLSNSTNNSTDREDFKVKIQGLKFSAFRKWNKTSLDFEKERIVCDFSKKAKPGNDIIPIAVGGVLTGCLVISLIGYLVIRARKS